MSSTFTKEEKYALSVLAGIQFLSVLDFIIIMPLGPQFLRVFNISPEKFGYIVSSYTLSAAILGFIGAFFIDRFDRKKSLLVLFTGFLTGTFLCGISSSYIYLLISRLIA
ncbi:MAG: MFS transporter, partial [Candidatus Sericytochromatia bacterium]